MRPKVTTDKQDREFLALRRQGRTCREIGAEYGIPTATIHRSISRARLAETPAGPQIPCPRLEPLFPIDSFTPHSKCPHHGPIKRGSNFVCMVCREHQSGQDHHPALKRTPMTDPRPEPKPAPPAGKKRTRKQRRALIERLNPSKN